MDQSRERTRGSLTSDIYVLLGYMYFWIHVLLETCIVGDMYLWIHVLLETCTFGYISTF